MTRQEKIEVVKQLSQELSSAACFYVTNAEGLKVSDTNDFRRECYKGEISYKIVKNTFAKKALLSVNSESEEYENFANEVFKGSTGLMIVDEICSTPAKIIKVFRKKKEIDIPILKGAYVDGDFYIGDKSLEVLSKLKSKKEIVGEIISLLQSPVKNVVMALQSGKHQLTGIIKTLSEKESKG